MATGPNHQSDLRSEHAPSPKGTTHRSDDVHQIDMPPADQDRVEHTFTITPVLYGVLTTPLPRLATYLETSAAASVVEHTKESFLVGGIHPGRYSVGSRSGALRAKVAAQPGTVRQHSLATKGSLDQMSASRWSHTTGRACMHPCRCCPADLACAEHKRN